MTIEPPANFTDLLYLDDTEGEAHINATLPLVWSQETHMLAVTNASQTTSGVINTGAQTIAGAKTFTAAPSCAVAATQPEHLVNLGTIDDLIAMGVHWLRNVSSFYDFSSGPPAAPDDGERLIAIATVGLFVKDDIYQYDAALEAWTDFVPAEGNALYVESDTSPLFANNCIIYNGTEWVNLGSSINHQSLIGAGTLTHSTIDSRLGQALNTTSTPSFLRLAITDTTSSTSSTTGCALFSGGIGAAGSIHSAIDSGIMLSTDKSTSMKAGTYARFSTAYNPGVYFNRVDETGDHKWELSMLSGTEITLYNRTDAWYAWRIASDGVMKLVRGLMCQGDASFTTTTPSGSTTTGCAKFAGGVGIAGALYAGGVLRVTDTTPSTSSTTGCATFAGGVGIAGSLYVARNITDGPVLSVQNSYPTSRTTINDPTEVLRLTRLGTTGESWQAQAQFALDRYENVASNARSRLTIKLTQDLTSTVFANVLQLYGSGCMVVPTNIVSTDTLTGSIVTPGGAGFGGNVNVGGRTTSLTMTCSTAPAANTDVVRRVDLTAGSVNISTSGTIATTNTTPSASTTTGCATFAGGIGVAGRVTASTMTCSTAPTVATDVVRLTDITSYSPSMDLSVNSLLSATSIEGGTVTVTGAIQGNLGRFYKTSTSAVCLKVGSDSGDLNWGGAYFDHVGVSSTSNTLSFGIGRVSGLIPTITLGSTSASFPQTTASDSATTGCATFAGGVGIAGALYAGGVLRVTNSTASASTTTGCATFAGGVGVSGALYAGGVLRVTDTTSSSTTTTGCATFAGGIGVAGTVNCASLNVTNAETLSGSWEYVFASGSEKAQTIYLERVGSIITVSAKTPTVNGTTTTAGAATYSVLLPSAWRPSSTVYRPIYFSLSGGLALATLVIVANTGQIRVNVSPLNDIPSGESWGMTTFSVQYAV